MNKTAKKFFISYSCALQPPFRTCCACNSLNTYAMHLYPGSKCFIWGPLSFDIIQLSKLRTLLLCHSHRHFPFPWLVLHVTHSIRTWCSCAWMHRACHYVLYRLVGLNEQNCEKILHLIEHVHTPTPFSWFVLHATQSIHMLCCCPQVQNASLKVLYRLASLNYRYQEHRFS